MSLTDANFPDTHQSLVYLAGERTSPKADAALEKLCTLYWAPLYAFLRRRGESPADAQDHVQGFFARLVEKDFLQQLDAERGRFRTFLRAALWHYVLNERRAERAERRGGARPPVSLEDLAGAENGLADVSAGITPDEVFDRRWAEGLVGRAHAALQEAYAAAGKAAEFAELGGWLTKATGPGDYAELAARRGVTENAIAAAVKRLRREYLDGLRRQVLATLESPADLEAELRYLLGVLLTEPGVPET